MTKWQLQRPDAPWDYPTLGFRADTSDAILDGTLFDPDLTVPPDAYWAVYTGASPETGVTRYQAPAAPPFPAPETTDGFTLVYSDAENQFVPASPADFMTSPVISAATDDLVASLIPDPGTATGAALNAVAPIFFEDADFLEAASTWGDSRYSQAFVPLNKANGNHPTVTPTGITLLAAPDSPTYAKPSHSIYFPCIVDERPAGGSGWAMYLSTDHDTGGGGIGKVVAANPLSPFTAVDTSLLAFSTINIPAGGTTACTQIETPSVLWQDDYTTPLGTLSMSSSGVITTASAHGLTVGRPVFVTAPDTGAATGITFAVPYYVATTPTSVTFTLSSTPTGQGQPSATVVPSAAGNVIVDIKGRWLLYGQCDVQSGGEYAQSSFVATSLASSPIMNADWTVVGLVNPPTRYQIPNPPVLDGLPANDIDYVPAVHTGYIKAYQIASTFWAHSLQNDTDWSTEAVWSSTDGIDWVYRGVWSNMIPFFANLGYDFSPVVGSNPVAIDSTNYSTKVHTTSPAAVIRWQGELWGIGRISGRSSGVGVSPIPARMVIYPLSDDLTGPTGNFVDITGISGSIAGQPFQFAGGMYMPYIKGARGTVDAAIYLSQIQ